MDIFVSVLSMLSAVKPNRVDSLAIALILMSALLGQGFAQETERVGPAKDGGSLVPTGQLIRPAGTAVAFAGRPIDLVLSPDGKRLYVKDNRGLVVLDARNWKLLQELSFPDDKTGGSVHGLAVRRDGRRVYVTTAQRSLYEAEIGDGGALAWKRNLTLPLGPARGKEPRDVHAAGVALSADGKRAFVCLSRNNSVAIVDLEAGKVLREIAVGVAPFAVVLNREESKAYVSNWGGRRPVKGERTAPSSGTPTLVDERGVASSGTVACIDLGKGKMVAETAVGLHPAGLALNREESLLYVANANSDTVSVLATESMKVEHTVLVRPSADLPFGSGTNALALSADGRTLFAANAGNNAVAVLTVGQRSAAPVVKGFIPTGWYPGAVVVDNNNIYIANVKGDGSQRKHPSKDGWNVHRHRGSVSRVPIPAPKQLRRYTAQVHEDARVPQILRAAVKAQSQRKPVPVPRQLGDPSLFEHVVYVIKENRTYDQVFGDVKEGNADAKLCIYGQKITPNHHALARQFVLLDNYYCNGITSSDGHAWATEGNVTDYLEKAFGGFTRTPVWGDDPLSYSSSGFIWDNALGHGLTFRSYGEMDNAATVPKDATFEQIYKDYRDGTKKITFKQSIGIERLRHYSAPDFPGWNLKIPDVQRVDLFLGEFRKAQQKGEWPNLVMVYLGNDHTAGATAGMPTPRAQVADNDLALGRLVEAISHSKFWSKTCIFVIEDDPQDGFDHVDGHRSLCLCISPYTKRKQVVSQFYNQTSVLHTMERILGLPPMNQMDALAPIMDACFTDKADLTPFQALPNNIPLNEMNKSVNQLHGQQRMWTLRSQELDFSRRDRADDDTLNRILWHAAQGVEAPYPSSLAGNHGRGLKALRLRHDVTR